MTAREQVRAERMDRLQSVGLEELVARARIMDADDFARLIEIRTATRPAILRWRRRARRRAVLRRAWELRRFILVPIAFAMIWVGFCGAWGLAGLVAALMGTSLSVLLYGLVISWE